MKIYNIGWFKNSPIGDRMSSPLDYFDFPIPSEKWDIKTQRFDDLRNEFIIFGGGGHIHLPSPDYNYGIMPQVNEIANLSPWTIAWGLGHNIYHTKEQNFPDSLNGYKLVGIRDTCNPFEWVPCASCMLTCWGKRTKKKREEGFIGYIDESIKMGMDVLNIYNLAFEEISDFIRSTAIVFTNSYHVAYWTMLSRKRSVVLFPHSSKFYKIHPYIALCERSRTIDDYLIKGSKSDPNFLRKCREANIQFHQKVLKLIEEANG